MTETATTESNQPEISLLRRVVRGTAWSGAGQASSFLLPMLRNLVLMRFLLPAQFGLWWAVTTVVVGARVFTDVGLTVALVQKPEGEREDYLSTVWLVQALRGLLLALLTFFSAPLVAWFYHAPEVKRPFQVMAVVFLLGGLGSPRIFLFVRNLDFKKLVLMEQLSAWASFAVAVGLGVWLRSVWALVYAEIVREFVFLVVGYRAAPFRPVFRFFTAAFKDLWHFGKHLYLANVSLYFLLQGGNLVVGRMRNPAELGQFNMGSQFAHLPGMNVGAFVGKVLFPAYARIQDDRGRVAAAYLRVLSLTACYAWPAALGLMFLAHVIPQYAGPAWQPVVEPMRIMCIAGLAQALNSTGGSLFLGIGRPDLLARVAFLNLLLMAVLILPLTHYYGIVGAAWSITLSQIPTAALVFYVLHREIGLSWTHVARALLAPVPATTAMTTVLLVLFLLVLPWYVYVPLVLLTGSLVYLAVLWFTAPAPVAEFKRALKEGFQTRHDGHGEDHHPDL